MKRLHLLLLVLMFALTANAAPAAVNIVITGGYTFYLDYDDEEETTDWFFSATDDSGLYTVRLDYPADESGKYGTYTYQDLDRDFSYIRDYSSGELEYLNYVEGTTFTVSDNNGLLHIDGTLVCDNGMTYNLQVDHTPQTFDVEGTELNLISYYSADTDWYIYFNDGSHNISLDIITGSQSAFSGTYDESAAVAEYNFASRADGTCYDPFVSLDVTLSMPDGVTDPTQAFEVTGTALSEHGDTYHFHMLKGLPITPVRTVNLNVALQTAEWPSDRDDCRSYFELTQQDDPQLQWNLGLNALTGTFSTSDIVDACTGRIDHATGQTLALDNGTVTAEFADSTHALHVSAALVMRDSVEYRFAFDYPLNVRGTRSYDFSNLTVNYSYYDSQGYLWLDASTDSVNMRMTLTGVDIPGEYADADASVQLVIRDPDGEKSSITSTIVIDASTTLDAHNQPVLQARFLGSDKRIYHLCAHHDIPEPTDTLSLSIEGLKVSDMTQSARAFQLFGYNADSTVYISIVPEATQIAGSYTTADLATYNRYTLIALRQPDGTYQTNDIYEAQFTVTQTDSDVTLTGTVQAGPHIILLSLQGRVRPDGIDYDNEDADVDVSFATDDIYELSSDQDYGYAYVELRNAARNDIFALLIYTDTFDPDIVIPAGTYQVNETYTAPSVQPGILSGGNVYATFYGTLTADGYLNTPMWFLRSGTVTVTKTQDNQLQLEVNGQNSYGRTIHVSLNGTNALGTTRIDATAARKLLQQGLVIIVSGKQRYTQSGQPIR